MRSPRRALRGASLRGAVEIVLACLSSPVAHRRFATWGAAPDEVAAELPGDELVPRPTRSTTRAVTVDAPPEDVWPWLAQIGQGRGGLYSYDGLENLIGCHIHSVDRLLDERDRLAVGDLVRLGPEGYPCFVVHEVQRPDHLVLAGADPRTGRVAPLPFDDVTGGATWQWCLTPIDDGRRTRLVTRSRLVSPRSQRWLWRVLAPISFVMERRMLLGLAERATRPATAQRC